MSNPVVIIRKHPLGCESCKVISNSEDGDESCCAWRAAERERQAVQESTCKIQLQITAAEERGREAFAEQRKVSKQQQEKQMNVLKARKRVAEIEKERAAAITRSPAKPSTVECLSVSFEIKKNVQSSSASGVSVSVEKADNEEMNAYDAAAMAENRYQKMAEEKAVLTEKRKIEASNRFQAANAENLANQDFNKTIKMLEQAEKLLQYHAAQDGYFWEPVRCSTDAQPGVQSSAKTTNKSKEHVIEDTEGYYDKIEQQYHRNKATSVSSETVTENITPPYVPSFTSLLQISSFDEKYKQAREESLNDSPDVLNTAYIDLDNSYLEELDALIKERTKRSIEIISKVEQEMTELREKAQHASPTQKRTIGVQVGGTSPRASKSIQVEPELQRVYPKRIIEISTSNQQPVNKSVQVDFMESNIQPQHDALSANSEWSSSSYQSLPSTHGMPRFPNLYEHDSSTKNLPSKQPLNQVSLNESPASVSNKHDAVSGTPVPSFFPPITNASAEKSRLKDLLQVLAPKYAEDINNQNEKFQKFAIPLSEPVREPQSPTMNASYILNKFFRSYEKSKISPESMSTNNNNNFQDLHNQVSKHHRQLYKPAVNQENVQSTPDQIATLSRSTSEDISLRNVNNSSSLYLNMSDEKEQSTKSDKQKHILNSDDSKYNSKVTDDSVKTSFTEPHRNYNYLTDEAKYKENDVINTSIQTQLPESLKQQQTSPDFKSPSQITSNSPELNVREIATLRQLQQFRDFLLRRLPELENSIEHTDAPDSEVIWKSQQNVVKSHLPNGESFYYHELSTIQEIDSLFSALSEQSQNISARKEVTGENLSLHKAAASTTTPTKTSDSGFPKDTLSPSVKLDLHLTTNVNIVGSTATTSTTDTLHPNEFQFDICPQSSKSLFKKDLVTVGTTSSPLQVGPTLSDAQNTFANVPSINKRKPKYELPSLSSINFSHSGPLTSTKIYNNMKSPVYKNSLGSFHPLSFYSASEEEKSLPSKVASDVQTSTETKTETYGKIKASSSLDSVHYNPSVSTVRENDVKPLKIYESSSESFQPLQFSYSTSEEENRLSQKTSSDNHFTASDSSKKDEIAADIASDRLHNIGTDQKFVKLSGFKSNSDSFHPLQFSSSTSEEKPSTLKTSSSSQPKTSDTSKKHDKFSTIMKTVSTNSLPSKIANLKNTENYKMLNVVKSSSESFHPLQFIYSTSEEETSLPQNVVSESQIVTDTLQSRVPTQSFDFLKSKRIALNNDYITSDNNKNSSESFQPLEFTSDTKLDEYTYLSKNSINNHILSDGSKHPFSATSQNTESTESFQSLPFIPSNDTAEVKSVVTDEQLKKTPSVQSDSIHPQKNSNLKFLPETSGKGAIPKTVASDIIHQGMSAGSTQSAVENNRDQHMTSIGCVTSVNKFPEYPLMVTPTGSSLGSDESIGRMFTKSKIMHQSTPVKVSEKARELPYERDIREEPDLTLIGHEISSFASPKKDIKSFASIPTLMLINSENDEDNNNGNSTMTENFSDEEIISSEPNTEKETNKKAGVKINAMSESMVSFLKHEFSALNSADENVSLFPGSQSGASSTSSQQAADLAPQSVLKDKTNECVTPKSAKKLLNAKADYKERTKRLWNNLEEVKEKKKMEEKKKAFLQNREKAKEFYKKLKTRAQTPKQK